MKIFNTFIHRYLLNFDYKRLIQLGWVRHRDEAFNAPEN
jgi:hypothetical protein